MIALVSFNADAQVFNNPEKTTVKRISTSAEVNQPTVVSNSVATKGVSAEDVNAIIEKAKLPPTEMTPEQKAEIDLAAQKDIRLSVKKQPIRERKDFITSLVTNEKIKQRRQALLEGKTEEDAMKISEEVEKPDINPAKNSEMEQYLYERAGLNND